MTGEGLGPAVVYSEGTCKEIAVNGLDVCVCCLIFCFCGFECSSIHRKLYGTVFLAELACALTSRPFPHTVSPPPTSLWSNISLTSPGPCILSPPPPPRRQSSKKLKIIHKDRLLFKALPSKGTITRKTLIIIYKSFIYDSFSNTPSYLIFSA